MSADFALERFERVDASATTALLRLSGRWSVLPSAEARALVVGDRRFAPLPDPGTDGVGTDEVWRGAYPVPVSSVDAPGASFALANGSALPAPVAPGAPMPEVPADAVTPVAEIASERDREAVAYHDVRHEVDELRRQLARGSAAAEQRVAEQAAVARRRIAGGAEEAREGIAAADERTQALEQQLAEQSSRAAQETYELLQLARAETEALRGELVDRAEVARSDSAARVAAQATVAEREAELADVRDQCAAAAAEAQAAARARDEAIAEAQRRREGERRLEQPEREPEPSRRPTRRRWRRGAKGDEPDHALAAEASRRAQAEARAEKAELRISELEGRMLELEFARVEAQERADELAARLPDGG